MYLVIGWTGCICDDDVVLLSWTLFVLIMEMLIAEVLVG